MEKRRRHRHLVHISSRMRTEQGSEAPQEELAAMEVGINVIVAVVAIVSLLFAGVGAYLQWAATRDQLQQSADARDQKQKEDAALFDARSEGGYLYLANYSRHTVKTVEAHMQLSDGKVYVFPVRSVGPCRQVVFRFRYTPKGKKPGPAKVYLYQVVYRDWEGLDWSTGGGMALTHVNDAFRKRLRSKAAVWATLPKLLDWPRKETEISDCAGG